MKVSYKTFIVDNFSSSRNTFRQEKKKNDELDELFHRSDHAFDVISIFLTGTARKEIIANASSAWHKCMKNQ